MIIQCEDGLSRELRMKVTVWQIFKSAFFFVFWQIRQTYTHHLKPKTFKCCFKGVVG